MWNIDIVSNKSCLREFAAKKHNKASCKNEIAPVFAK